MRVFSSNILFLSKYLVSITCSSVLFRNFARAMLMFSRDICDVFYQKDVTNVTREHQHRASEISKQHCCKLWKQDIYLEIRYLRKIPAFLGRLCTDEQIKLVQKLVKENCSSVHCLILRNLIYRCSAYAARVRKFPTIIVNNKNGCKIANIRPNDTKLGYYQA